MTSNKQIYGESETKWGCNHNQSLNIFEQRLADRYVAPLARDARLLEAGCGAGRISERLSEMGFARIDAFDFVERFIESASSRGSSVHYFVADASALPTLESNTYDCVIYLQRVICFVSAEKIDAALQESARVCKDGGVALFSFLNYDGRRVNHPLSVILAVLRKMRGENLSSQQLPWLKLGGKPNWYLLQKGQATVYWFTYDEIRSRLEKAGYEIMDSFTSAEGSGQGSIIYVACRKKNSSG